MILQIATIAYLFIAIGMTVLILMQRGSGAGARGFGGGGSASVFGASGSSNFLSKATKWMAIVFFILSLGMAMYVSRGGRPAVELDMGVMGSVPTAEQSVPAAGGDVPRAPEVPAAPVPEPAPEAGEDEVEPVEVPPVREDEPQPEGDPRG
ncbi:preprotein translocase subunit SecG [Alkalisalibacterium limincola]|uniref:Protein-export membrane protein SecG n=1 Tax=Alkalisalibacterium limincola TaxID=2699169 RepID=A0A5C8KVG1_9GAMM|nr:preprotein translocase subunit SecG [Alkalisalibacterium limincola]TXK65749.1 preprotein translocase subunit SecG [Alkalisalibacterium limincola]